MQLDRAHFAHMTGGDLVLQREVIGLFRDQIPLWRARLVPGADWRDAAHTVKGSARGIGLGPLAEACAGTEARTDAEAADAVAQVHAALDAALAAVETYDGELAALTAAAPAR